MKPHQSSRGPRYLFGPVISRRLGRSLGVDMVPSKVCSLNCIYCESGSTTLATRERREYIPTEGVIRELDEYLRDHPPIDMVTFSGAGEPTLHIGIGRVTEFMKQHYPEYRIALLTNATLLPDAGVRAELRGIDLIIPSLDAADDRVMAQINRPVDGVTVKDMIEGLVAFRSESAAQMWLEIFIVPGVNDSRDHLLRLRDAALRIAPDRVQLNTLDRPGPEPWVTPAERQELECMAALFRPLPVEIIARRPAPPSGMESDHVHELEERILALVRRRPCTLPDLVTGLGASPATVTKALRSLRNRNVLVPETRERGVFYRPAAGR